MLGDQVANFGNELGGYGHDCAPHGCLVFGDRLVLLWEDAADDHSPACQRARECVHDVYGLIVRPDGTQDGVATRLTHAAAWRPLISSSHDWQRHCP